MNWELAFTIANISVLPAWFLLVVFPKSQATKTVVYSWLYPISLALVYLALTIYSFGGEGGMDTLENLKTSFQRSEVLLLGWVHYLAFDLFIGAWISRDSIKNQVSQILVKPCLVLTLFAGPIGLLSYAAIRSVKLRKLTL